MQNNKYINKCKKLHFWGNSTASCIDFWLILLTDGRRLSFHIRFYNNLLSNVFLIAASFWSHIHSTHSRKYLADHYFYPSLWSIALVRWLIHSSIIYSCVDFMYKLLHLLLLGSQFWSSLLKINNTYLLREPLGNASCDGFCCTPWH